MGWSSKVITKRERENAYKVLVRKLSSIYIEATIAIDDMKGRIEMKS